MTDDLVKAINRLAAAIEASTLAAQTPDDQPTTISPGTCRACAGRGETGGRQCRPWVGRGRIQVP